MINQNQVMTAGVGCS